MSFGKNICSQKYEYQPQYQIILMGLILFGTSTFVLGYLAYTNQKRLVLYHITELSVEYASIFYWGLSMASFVLFFLSALFLIQRLTQKTSFLEINHDYFILPRVGYFRKKKIFYKGVKNIQKQEFKGTINFIFHTQNSKATLSNRNFKSAGEFLEAVDTIIGRCKR